MERGEVASGSLRATSIMPEKLITNETSLARMTRGPHSNAKASLRTMLPPLTNGKSSHSVSKCSSEMQPKRSVITLKNAPGPTVNSSGTGLLKTKMPNADGDKGRAPRSRKRSRDADGGAETPDPKAEQSLSALELVESTKRRRRGKSSSRKHERKNARLPSGTELILQRHNSGGGGPGAGGAAGILDIYGLKSKTVDLTMYQLDIPLEKLMSGDFEVPQTSAVESDPGESDCRNLIERHMSNIMALLPKRTSIRKSLAENEDDVKVRLMLDLERPFQPEEEDRLSEAADQAKARSKAFAVEDLPWHSCDEFMGRLKLPINDLDSLISSLSPSVSTEHPGTVAEKSSKFEGIPPSPFSFSPVGVGDCGRAPRNGRCADRKDAADGSSKEKLEPPDSAAGPKEEMSCDAAHPQDVQKKKRLSDKEEDEARIGLPSLRVKLDESGTLHHRHSLANSPVMPSSPGVQAAALLLCNMANSDMEKQNAAKGKRQKVFSEEPSHRPKTSRFEDRGHVPSSSQEGGQPHKSSKEASTSQQQPGKKSLGTEKRKSLSQVNHSLSKRPSISKLGSSSNLQASRTVKCEQQQQQQHRDSSSAKDRHAIQVSSSISRQAYQAPKSKDNQIVGKVKLNGIVGSSSKKLGSGSSSGSGSSKVVARSAYLTTASEASGSLKSSRRMFETKQARSKHDLRGSSKLGHR